MQKFLFASLFLAVLTIGCKPNYYIPNAQNVPMLRKKGETRLSVVVGNVSGLEAAYAIKDNLGVLVNLGSAREKTDDGNGGSGGVLEGGFGWSRNLGQNFRFETYALLGRGRMENHFVNIDTAAYRGDIKASMLRVGIQPAIGYSGKYFEAIFSVRAANLKYKNIEGDLRKAGVNEVTALKARSSSFLAEPALTLRAGYDPIKFQLQFQQSYNLSHSDFYQSKGTVTLGLTARF